MANVSTSKGVDFIVNSKKPYPEWIKNHSVFREMNKIDKVFPRIGLPNFKESCDIMNSAEALSDANKLGNKLRNELAALQNRLYAKLDEILLSAEKDRNELCNKLQHNINIVSVVKRSLDFGDYAKVVDGKVVMKLRADIFGGEKNPIFRKDEAVLRVMNKISEMVSATKVDFIQIDQMPEFKDFSRTNVPNKKYTLAFSSSGEDGAWDISTISMRGVSSCQSWNAPQSRGLIGSIASKFVGVIYLASDQDIPGYGSKMLQRCVVRFCINKTTKKPTLIMDRMYPSENADTRAVFKRVLKEKSGIDVVYTGENPSTTDYYIPDEPSRKHLKQGEHSYMDHAVNVQQHTASIKKSAAPILTALTTDFKKLICTELEQQVKVKRNLYETACAQLEKLKAEYAAEKAKWEEANKDIPEAERPKFALEEPKMDAELHNFFRGGIENLFKHCDKKHGKDSAAKVFATFILNSFDNPDDMQCASKEEFQRKYLMGFLRNPKGVRERANKEFAKGTWMKSFPRSAEKFYEYVFSQMKPFVLGSVKDMIRKSN